MGLDWQKPGVGSVGEYQVAGHTYISDRTSGNNTVELEFLSSEVTIVAEVDGLGVTFEDGAGNTRLIHLPAGTHTFKIKCKKIVFSNSKAHSAVIACTNIPESSYTAPTFTVLGT